MTTSELVSVAWLAQTGLLDPRVRIVDFRWYLRGKDAQGARTGKDEYARGHLPGAVFVDLDDVTAPEGPGRHPIPDAAAMTRAMRRAGVSASSHVVIYDDAGGSIAARLWWLLRRYGHARASVLDGGSKAWTEAGHALTSEVPSVAEGDFQARVDPTVIAVDKEYVDQARQQSGVLVLDARAEERYRGDAEPIDARPGHVPGANARLDAQPGRRGRFKSPEDLASQFAALGADGAREVVVYCGSGVTACHDWLALKRAGVPDERLRLYEGSWSDWARDPSLPAARGAS